MGSKLNTNEGVNWILTHFPLPPIELGAGSAQPLQAQLQASLVQDWFLPDGVCDGRQKGTLLDVGSCISHISINNTHLLYWVVVRVTSR